MRLFILPLAMLACLGPAAARCPLYLPMRVGPVTGNPEKDTVGLFCAQPEPALPVASAAGGRLTTRVGAPTGDAEKDTIGFAPPTGMEQAAR